jgi:hypothetical protein
MILDPLFSSTISLKVPENETFALAYASLLTGYGSVVDLLFYRGEHK